MKLFNGYHFTTSNLKGNNTILASQPQNLCFLPLCVKTPQQHSKKCWVVSTQIWLKYGQTQMLG